MVDKAKKNVLVFLTIISLYYQQRNTKKDRHWPLYPSLCQRPGTVLAPTTSLVSTTAEQIVN